MLILGKRGRTGYTGSGMGFKSSPLIGSKVVWMKGGKLFFPVRTWSAIVHGINTFFPLICVTLKTSEGCAQMFAGLAHLGRHTLFTDIQDYSDLALGESSYSLQ